MKNKNSNSRITTPKELVLRDNKEYATSSVVWYWYHYSGL